jgi:hypothetical protein
LSNHMKEETKKFGKQVTVNRIDFVSVMGNSIRSYVLRVRFLS